VGDRGIESLALFQTPPLRAFLEARIRHQVDQGWRPLMVGHRKPAGTLQGKRGRADVDPSELCLVREFEAQAFVGLEAFAPQRRARHGDKPNSQYQ